MATNARLVKLQTQLNTIKQDIPETKEKLKTQVDERGAKSDKLCKRLVEAMNSQLDSFKLKQEELNEKNKSAVEANRNKLSKQHASIIDLQAKLTKQGIDLEEMIVPLREKTT